MAHPLNCLLNHSLFTSRISHLYILLSYSKLSYKFVLNSKGGINSKSAIRTYFDEPIKTDV